MDVKIDHVTKTYGDVTALDDVSFEVEGGATFGLLGTNGAGKTTLIKLLVGLDTPDEGNIYVGRTDVRSAGRRMRALVGYLPQRVGFPSKLTGREVLTFTGRARRIPAADLQERIPDVLETVGLTHAADRSVGGYSGGMHRRLGLASAILDRPSVLVLDEPTAGLDPEGVAEYHRVIESIRDRTDSTVIFSSHVLSEVESLCDSIAILHQGELRTAGSVDELTERADEETTVRMRVDDPETATSIALEYGDVTAVENDTIEITSPDARSAELISAVGAEVTIETLDVDRPGLAAIFRDATGLPGEAEANA